MRDLQEEESDPLKPSIQVFNKHNQRKRTTQQKNFTQSQVWPKKVVLLPSSSLIVESSSDSELDFERTISEGAREIGLFDMNLK